MSVCCHSLTHTHTQWRELLSFEIVVFFTAAAQGARGGGGAVPGAGVVPVRCWCGAGGAGAAPVWCRCGASVVPVWCWCCLVSRSWCLWLKVMVLIFCCLSWLLFKSLEDVALTLNTFCIH